MEDSGKCMRHVKHSAQHNLDTKALTHLIETAYFDMKRRFEAGE
ncbi:MAG TPA: hypothetical protein VGJ02_03220 [Pyrinomonadaceae bacterium]|jgi:hypothetical protein